MAKQDLRTGARSGNGLSTSGMGFQSSNQIGVSTGGNTGATWNAPIGGKNGQNSKGAVPNVLGGTGRGKSHGVGQVSDSLRTGGKSGRGLTDNRM